jgi:hypothetical protein
MLEQLIVGLHIASAHFPEREIQSNDTPGIYARTNDGWTAGAVRNSYERWAIYAGKQFEPFKHVSLAVGVISGYQHEDRPCTSREKHEHKWKTCWTGVTSQAISPMLVPSVHYEVAKDATVRLNYMPRWSKPNASEAINLAVEYRFK